MYKIAYLTLFLVVMGCSHLTSSVSVNTRTEAIEKLEPPRLGEQFVKEKITCVRPSREGIFRIESAVEQDKLVTHIYGHGGAGLTLAPGSVEDGIKKFDDALAQNPRFRNQPIRVVGGGVMGMWSAVALAKKGHQVKVSAKDIKNLASFKAAGIFGPAPDSMLVTKKELARVDEIAASSYRIYGQIAAGNHAYLKGGPEALPLYVGAGTESGLEPLVKMGVIPKPQDVVIDFGNGKLHRATKFQSFFINGPALMSELHRLAKELKIEIIEQEIATLTEIKEKVVFNCTGIGAKQIANDEKMVPVQGHIVMLKDQLDRPKRNYMVLAELNGEMIYVTPKSEGAIGSSFIKGEASLDANPHQFERVLARAKAFFGETPTALATASNLREN